MRLENRYHKLANCCVRTQLAVSIRSLSVHSVHRIYHLSASRPRSASSDAVPSRQRTPGAVCAHTAIPKNRILPQFQPPLTGPAELHMASAPEYNLRDMGPWEPGTGNAATTTMWVSPDPIYPGREIFYFEANGVYVRPQSPNTSEPVYFAGTDPRDPGFPPPEDEAEVGNPRVQWERSL